MGWALGTNQHGEDIGYGVPATCTLESCGAQIDRGLAYTCGGLEGHYGGKGCGRPFCGEHLYFVGVGDALCAECADHAQVDEDVLAP